MRRTSRLVLLPALAFTLGCSLVGQVAQSLSLPSPTPSATAVPSPTATATAEPVAYTPPQCAAIAVATLEPSQSLTEPTPVPGANTPLSSEEQRAVLDQVVRDIQRVYLYPEAVNAAWQSEVERVRSAIEAGLETEKFYDNLRQLVFDLGDDHSQFESPADVLVSNAELAGTNEYVGVGALVQQLPDKGKVTILAVFPGSPASFSGLQPHDSILATDGVPIVQNGRAYPGRLRGPECTAVVLTVQTPGGTPRQVTVLRARVTSGLPIDSRLVPTTDGSRIGYIFLPTFFDETIPLQVRKALEDFGPLDGLILDNRMNGGGSSDVVEPILGFFTTGELGHFVSRDAERPLLVEADPIQNSGDVPLIVLVGQDTVSFGEIFSGILQDVGRAWIVGQTTLGNVETLHGYNYRDGSRLWLAEERFDPLNSHANWEASGILPDVSAFADWDTYTFATDPSVAAALKLLGH